MNLPLFREQTTNTQLLKLAATRPSLDVVVVEAHGEVDMTTMPMLRKELYAAMRPTPAALVVDLADIDFFGSSGITTLMELHRHCAEFETQFRLVAPRTVHRVLELVGVGGMFTLFDSRAQAVAHDSSK